MSASSAASSRAKTAMKALRLMLSSVSSISKTTALSTGTSLWRRQGRLRLVNTSCVPSMVGANASDVPLRFYKVLTAGPRRPRSRGGGAARVNKVEIANKSHRCFLNRPRKTRALRLKMWSNPRTLDERECKRFTYVSVGPEYVPNSEQMRQGARPRRRSSAGPSNRGPVVRKGSTFE